MTDGDQRLQRRVAQHVGEAHAFDLPVGSRRTQDAIPVGQRVDGSRWRRDHLRGSGRCFVPRSGGDSRVRSRRRRRRPCSGVLPLQRHDKSEDAEDQRYHHDDRGDREPVVSPAGGSTPGRREVCRRGEVLSLEGILTIERARGLRRGFLVLNGCIARTHGFYSFRGSATLQGFYSPSHSIPACVHKIVAFSGPGITNKSLFSYVIRLGDKERCL